MGLKGVKAVNALELAELELMLINVSRAIGAEVRVLERMNKAREWVLAITIGEKYNQRDWSALWVSEQGVRQVFVKAILIKFVISKTLFDEPVIAQEDFWESTRDELIYMFDEANPEYKEFREYKTRRGYEE
jgi:hypothetical protein